MKRLTLTLAAALSTALLITGCSGDTEPSPETGTTPSEAPTSTPEPSSTAKPAPKPLIPVDTRPPAKGDQKYQGVTKFVTTEASFSLLGNFTVPEARAAVAKSDTFMRDVYARSDRYAKGATHFLTSEDIAAVETTFAPKYARELLNAARTLDRIQREWIQADRGEEFNLTTKQREIIGLASVLFAGSPDMGIDRITYRANSVKASTSDAANWRGLLIVTYDFDLSEANANGMKALRVDLGWKQLANGQWLIATSYWSDPDAA